MSEAVKATKTEQTKAKIELHEHAPFGGNLKSNLMSSMDMADIVSTMFGGVFRDYAGCKIRINDGRGLPAVVAMMPAGALYVDLYFKMQKGKDGIENLIIPGSEKEEAEKKGEKLSLAQRFANVTGTTPGRVYKVTKETYECLEDYMFTGARTNWLNHTQEITAQMHPYSKDEVLVCISGLDLNKIITAIYGAKTEEGRFEYMAMPSTIIPNKADEFVLTVTQLDLETVHELQTTLGIYTTNTPTFHQWNG